MITLEDAGYMYQIHNSGKTYFLLIRLENDLIKFFLRKEKSGTWIESFSVFVHNDFSEMIAEKSLNWYDEGKVKLLVEYYESHEFERDAAFLEDFLDVVEQME